MFIDNLQHDPAYYITVVTTVTVSIVLHELGHGIAAIQQGDDTPIAAGHMTWNPLVHMGAMGLGLLLVVGVAFGSMPVSPRRFRSPYGEAIVAAAGPLVNATLALLALTLFAGLLSEGIDPRIGGANPLWILGLLNIVLFLFNMIPIAPLDGAAVLGNFVPAYHAFLTKPENGKFIWVAFGVVFFMAGRLFRLGADIASGYVDFILSLA
ncbi:MAG: site-2 protease family protein [Myxococcota bacterium]|jgi:Zn-dependent protease|nr:site-2 protease family protein [Myxococcota bacterium]